LVKLSDYKKVLFFENGTFFTRNTPVSRLPTVDNQNSREI